MQLAELSRIPPRSRSLWALWWWSRGEEPKLRLSQIRGQGGDADSVFFVRTTTRHAPARTGPEPQAHRMSRQATRISRPTFAPSLDARCTSTMHGHRFQETGLAHTSQGGTRTRCRVQGAAGGAAGAAWLSLPGFGVRRERRRSWRDYTNGQTHTEQGPSPAHRMLGPWRLTRHSTPKSPSSLAALPSERPQAIACAAFLLTRFRHSH